MLIPQDNLIQQNRAQGEQLAALQAFDRPLTTPLKDVFEDAVERLDGQRPQLMKHASDFDPAIPVRIRATTRGDQCAVGSSPFLAQRGGVVMRVTQHVPHR